MCKDKAALQCHALKHGTIMPLLFLVAFIVMLIFLLIAGALGVHKWRSLRSEGQVTVREEGEDMSDLMLMAVLGV